MTDVFDELRWRGLVSQTTDEPALRQALRKGSITFYCGFDPTAPSLHVGNLVQLITMRHLQRAGHRPLCLVGGSTGLIGDPKPTAERKLHSKEVVAEWVEKIERQVQPFLDFDGPHAARLVNNLDWTASLSTVDFLRDIGRHFRVSTMLRKDAVATRLTSDAGISYTEFSYQILQGLDFLQLYRDFGCTMQTGGQDQWGNLVAGSDLIHRTEAATTHLLTTPLITKADGTKFGKTENGTVWLDPEMTSPYALYQFWINVEDASVMRYLRVFTDLSRAHLDEIHHEVRNSPGGRRAQRELAAEVTDLIHGEKARRSADIASKALFGGGDLGAVDEATVRDVIAEIPQVTAAVGSPIVDAFVGAGLAPSRGAARRVIAEGGAYVNNKKLSDPDSVVTVEQLMHRRYSILRRGKKTVAGLITPLSE
ncbi:MAG: tyrosine--tRNA ligase [Actinomycetota bacterium]